MGTASELLVLGLIHTLDPAHPVAQAALVRDGRFACVGTAEACTSRASPGARRLVVGSAVPGLVDAHGHVFGLHKARREVSCAGAPSEEACAALAAERARSRPGNAWVLGRGWDQNRWPGGRFPSEATLTRAVPDRPALLVRVDGHAAWANAAALAAAGVGPGTADPPGGRILRDGTGKPTGVLVDAAVDLVSARIPAPTAAELEEGLLAALSELARLGLTGVHDAGVGPATLDAYRKLAREGRLPVRVYAMIDGEVPLAALEQEIARQREEPEVGLLTVRAVKMYADGALGSRGAALLADYADDPGNRGLLVTAPDALRAKVKAVVGAGLQPCVHAIGDRGVEEALGAFVAAGDPARVKALRPRIEHLQIVAARDWAGLAAAGVVASMQPTHCTSDAPWVPARLGASSERIRGAYAWRTALARGLPLAFGSDFPVEEPDPRAGLAAAEGRLSVGATAAFLPEERLTRLEALRAFTSGAAHAAFAEARRGMIREGFEADLTAFDRDVLSVGRAALTSLKVKATVVAGRIVHVE